ncbi:MAG: MIP family channel protein [Planctomycetes bacterium]|nr:MIP family channel protein [Planctomycetota bacterium]
MRTYVAEAMGTFALVFAGCGAVVVNDATGALGHVGVSLVFGLVVMAMIYSVGNVSGAHLNPAVTLGFWAARRLRIGLVPRYVLAQCLGAVAGAALLRVLFPDSATLGTTVPAGVPWQSFLLEVVLTFLLMVVILNVSTGAMEKGIMAGVAVGGTIALEALFGGPVSGASMNPARSLGPALMAWRLDHLWIYLAAPVLGALAASRTCSYIQGPDCCRAPTNDPG